MLLNCDWFNDDGDELFEDAKIWFHDELEDTDIWSHDEDDDDDDDEADEIDTSETNPSLGLTGHLKWKKLMFSFVLFQKSFFRLFRLKQRSRDHDKSFSIKLIIILIKKKLI